MDAKVFVVQGQHTGQYESKKGEKERKWLIRARARKRERERESLMRNS